MSSNNNAHERAQARASAIENAQRFQTWTCYDVRLTGDMTHTTSMSLADTSSMQPCASFRHKHTYMPTQNVLKQFKRFCAVIDVNV